MPVFQYKIVLLNDYAFNVISEVEKHELKGFDKRDNTFKYRIEPNENLIKFIFENGFTIIDDENNREIAKQFILTNKIETFANIILYTYIDIHKIGINMFELELNCENPILQKFLKKNINGHIPDNQRNVITMTKIKQVVGDDFIQLNNELFQIMNCHSADEFHEKYHDAFNMPISTFKEMRTHLFSIFSPTGQLDKDDYIVCKIKKNKNIFINSIKPTILGKRKKIETQSNGSTSTKKHKNRAIFTDDDLSDDDDDKSL
jgi:hypothetical protein